MDGQPIQGHGAAAAAAQGLGVPAEAQQAPPTRLMAVWRLGGRTVSIVAGGLSVAGYGACRALAAAATAPGAVRDIGMRAAMRVPPLVYLGIMGYGTLEGARALVALYNEEPPPAGHWLTPLSLAGSFSVYMLERIGAQRREQEALEVQHLPVPGDPSPAQRASLHLFALKDMIDLLNGDPLGHPHPRSVSAVLGRLQSAGSGLADAQTTEQVREAVAWAIGQELGSLHDIPEMRGEVKRVMKEQADRLPARVFVALATGFFTLADVPQASAPGGEHAARRFNDFAREGVEFTPSAVALFLFAAQRLIPARIWVDDPADHPSTAVASHLGRWAAGGPAFVRSNSPKPASVSGSAVEPGNETKSETRSSAATPAELGEAMSRSPAAVLSTDLVGPADRLMLLRIAYELPGLLESCGIETQLREIGEAPVSLETQAEALCIVLRSVAPAQRLAVFEGARRILLREPDASRVSGKTPWSATSEQFTAILALYEAYLGLAPLADTGSLPGPERQALLNGYRSFLDVEAARMELLGAVGPPAIETNIETKADAKAEKKSAKSASADRADASRQLDAMLYERLSLFAQQLDLALHPPETKLG